METTLTKTLTSSTTTTTILSLLHFRRLSTSLPPPSLLTRRLSSAVAFSHIHLLRRRFLPHPYRCLSRSYSFGGGGGCGGGDGGSGGSDGYGKGFPKVSAGEDVPPLSPDAIVLDVAGMTCGGCAAKVKKILENQPQVSSATVNLATETAIVWPNTEATVVPNWRKELGELLAKQLTNCGFESNPRGEGDYEGEIPD